MGRGSAVAFVALAFDLDFTLAQSANRTLAAPALRDAGDTLITFYDTEHGPPASGPTGWTEITPPSISSTEDGVYRRIATDNASDDFTITQDAGSAFYFRLMAALRTSYTTFVRGSHRLATFSGAGQTAAVQGATAVGKGVELIFGIAAADNGTAVDLLTPAGFTVMGSITALGDSNGWNGVAKLFARDVAGAGVIGSTNLTNTIAGGATQGALIASKVLLSA
jgi:hypothetical protein